MLSLSQFKQDLLIHICKLLMYLPVSLSKVSRTCILPLSLKTMEYLLIFTVGPINWLVEVLSRKCFPSKFYNSFLIIICHLVVWGILLMFSTNFLHIIGNLYYAFHLSWMFLFNYVYLLFNYQRWYGVGYYSYVLETQ